MNYILAMNNPMKFIIATTILLNMICLASIKTKNIHTKLFIRILVVVFDFPLLLYLLQSLSQTTIK